MHKMHTIYNNKSLNEVIFPQETSSLIIGTKHRLGSFFSEVNLILQYKI